MQVTNDMIQKPSSPSEHRVYGKSWVLKCYAQFLAIKTRALCGHLSDVKAPVQIAADMIGIQ